jgi:FixJ family two-component response regulator
MNPAIPAVYIVDDDASVRRSLSRLVRQSGMDARAFASAEEYLLSHDKPVQQPACLVVDLTMPGLSGLDLQTELARRSNNRPVIFISGNADIPSTVRAMRQGAVTFLPKPFEPAELLRAIAEALEMCRKQLAADVEINDIAVRVGELTAREREVMSWVITGALNKQIAAELGIVERTVKVHRSRVMEKMQVLSVAELVRLCDAVAFAPAVRPQPRS